MFNKKLKQILASVVCGLLVITAIPELPARAEDTENVYTDCSEIADYKMSESNIWPNTSEAANDLTSGWKRTLNDTTDGLRITYGALMDEFSHSTRTATAVDGAHMRLTFHVPVDSSDTANTCDASKTVGITIGHKMNNSWKQGLSFKIQVATGQLYCSVDGTALDFSEHEDVYSSTITDRLLMPADEFDRNATTLDIRTSIADSGDFVLNLNGYEFTVAKSVWEGSESYGKQVYFKVGTKGKILDCTWNFLHSEEATCYSKVTEADALISSMPTYEEIIVARKAYLALSEQEKALVVNADKIKATAGQLKNSEIYKMTDSKVYPAADKWPNVRTLEKTDDGVKVTYPAAGNYSAYSTRTTAPVVLDGAHMKLTTSGNARFIVVINNGGTGYNDVASGLKLRIEKWSSKVTCLIDNVQVGEQTTLENPISDDVTTELLIKTTIKENGDLNIAINDNNIVIAKATWEASSYMNANSSYFLVSYNDGNGYAFSYTWNYIFGGDAINYDAISDAETKIELCDSTTPALAYVEAARNAYTGLSDEQKAMVINHDTLVDAELKLAEVTEMKVYDLFDLTQMVRIPNTHLSEARPLGIGEESKKANIGVKMMVTIWPGHGEARFGLCKNSVLNLQDGSGYDIQVKADGIAIQRSNPITDLAKVNMTIPGEFVLEYGVANMYNSAEQIVARKISVKIDGTEVLAYADSEMSDTMGNMTTVWADSPMVLSNIDSVEEKDIDIYLIAGQSNAAGCSTYSATGLEALDYRYVNGYSNVLYVGSADGGSTRQLIQPVRAGLGMYDFYIGPELGLANALSETYNTTTGKHAGIIKFALGGTALVHHVVEDPSLDEPDWVSPSYEATLTEGVTEYTGSLYDGFLAEVETQLEAYRQAGYNPTVKGLYWMQGEEDRYHSERYPEAFRYFASDIRNDLTELTGQNLTSMPIVMGLISRTACSATAGSAGTNQKFIAMQKTLPEQVCNLRVNDSSEFDMNALDPDGNNVSISSDPINSAHWKWEDVVTIGNMVGDKFLNDLDVDDHVKKEKWVSDAENHWKTCQCGESQSDVAAHKPNLVNKKDATVEKEGYTGDKVCSICGYVIEQGTKIDKVKEVITSMTLSKTSYVYDGRVKKPTVTVKNQNGKVMKASSYSVKYASGCKNVGTYKVTVTKDGKTLTKTFQIIPPVTSIKSISTGTTKPTVKWTKKTAGVTGYQIQYATNKSFKSAKTSTITKDTTTSKAISMSKGKTYYVRIRTYAKVSGKTYYSSWSSAKSTMIPNTTTLKSVKAGSKKITVKWTKKTSYVTGYQIQYSTSKSFKSAKTVTIKKDTTTSTTIKKLKGKKKYYVRIRTYAKSGSKTYYSAWGTAKSVKTKK